MNYNNHCFIFFILIFLPHWSANASEENVSKEELEIVKQKLISNKGSIKYRTALNNIINQRDTRVVGGTTVSIGDHPWQAGLVLSFIRSNALAHFCGAVWIADRALLTAAHCLQNTPKDDVQILFNTGDLTQAGKRTAVQHIERHPAFFRDDRKTPVHDLALVFVRPTSEAKPLGMISEVDDARLFSSNNVTNTTVTFTGWGFKHELGEKSDKLLVASVPLQKHTTCNRRDSHNGRVRSDSMICAGKITGGIDACTDDSGGPLTVVDQGIRKLIGIISWGDGCGVPKKFGVYIRVSKYLDNWITPTLLNRQK